ncbi:release factor glutamine methyltransferase [mine drainage metagenome]|uniref:Release factor glutamine methyltransferase n=1 Tax=mine drainage metagenome TaxID=410659 RepID=A0A1J5SEG3_9ZZZZ
MQALSRRVDRPHKKPKKAPANITEAFHLHRQAQSQKARILGMLIIEVSVGYHINLRRAPDIKAACEHAYGKSTQSFVVSLREILGLVGAYEWSKNGVEINAINNKIHPSYGVFSPIRGEYLELVDKAPLPKPCTLAFDIGTGTGVLAAILSNRGVSKVVATDNSQRALDCAQKNITQLGLKNAVTLLDANLFPDAEYGKADLIVCNPPWLPARPSSALESAIYDEGSKMLKGFLNGLGAHLNDAGEGWLVLSDFAEHLGLRTRDELLGWIAAAGLNVIDRTDTKASHNKTFDVTDPLHPARKAEITSLWRLNKQ